MQNTLKQFIKMAELETLLTGLEDFLQKSFWISEFSNRVHTPLTVDKMIEWQNNESSSDWSVKAEDSVDLTQDVHF